LPVLAADRDRRDDWFHLYTLRQRISPAAIVEEAGKFAYEVIAPLNRVGDTHGALFKDGAVTMPPGWKEAYRNWAAAGWNGLSAPVEWGGQGGPPTPSTRR
jgi:alkylation response protein AidB-like acyl-CoA dehydrogenase